MTDSGARSGSASPRRRGRRSPLALAAVSAGALMLTMATAGTASADPRASQIFVSPGGEATHMVCLDILSGSTANYAPVQVYACQEGLPPSQSFIEVEAGSTIRSGFSGKCLDIEGGGTAAGTKVDMYTCNGTGAQVWIPRSDRSLYNPQSNKCLDDTGSAYTDVQVEIWDCTGSPNQAWEQYLGR